MRREPWIAALVAAALYAPTVRYSFVFDDGPEIVQNEYVRSLKNLPRIFTHAAWAGSGEDNGVYRPLTTATYALDHALFGFSPAGYHATNVLLHALAAALVVMLAMRIGLAPWKAAAAGVLFAALPVHVEAVANVAGRKDELAAVFLLAMLLAHTGKRPWLGPLALLLATLSKEAGAAGLLLVLAHDIVFRKRARAALYGVYAGVTLLYLALRWSAVGSIGVPHISPEDNPLVAAPPATRMLTAVAIAGQGLLLQVAPLTLSPDYSFDAIPLAHPSSAAFLLSALAIVVLAALAWRFRPLGTFALLFYAVTLLPAANLLVPVGTIFGERLLYVPSVAVCIAAAAALPGSAAVVAAVVLGVRAMAYASAWSDELSLFAAAVRAQPRSERAHRLYAAALMEHGDAANAAAHLEQALRILDGAPFPLERARLELGVADEALGRTGDAARLYQRILRENPLYADAWWRLGDVSWAEGRRREAETHWRRAVEIDPRHARALSDLGIASWEAGDDRSAESLWQRAAAVDPRLATVWLRLATLYEHRGDPARARACRDEYARRAGQ